MSFYPSLAQESHGVARTRAVKQRIMVISLRGSAAPGCSADCVPSVEGPTTMIPGWLQNVNRFTPGTSPLNRSCQP